MEIIQNRVRGERPQRTPIEIIITVPHGGLHGSAEPSGLAMMADGGVIAAANARRLCCDAGVVVAHVDALGVPLSANGGKTALSNLMLLCSAHQTLLHEGGCRVESNRNWWLGFFRPSQPDHRRTTCPPNIEQY